MEVIDVEGTGLVDWPGVAQVCRITRSRKTALGDSQETSYAVTSLSKQKGYYPKRLLELNRGHWRIENQLHWVRDVVMNEDRNTTRTGILPQVQAALRNLTLTLLRKSGFMNNNAGREYFSANRGLAIKAVSEGRA